MFRRLRAAWAALTAPATTANTTGDLADEARAVQARTVDTVHMDTHHEGDTHHHGGQVMNNVHGGSVGVQAGNINGGTVIAGNSGIVNAGGNNSFTNTTVGGFHVGHNDGDVFQANQVNGGFHVNR